jgi:hypothetical protein
MNGQNQINISFPNLSILLEMDDQFGEAAFFDAIQ